MMAFFLLLWLLNAVSKEQLEGISDYFAPISTRTSTSGGGGLLAGKTVTKKGVFEAESAHGQCAIRERPSPGEMSEEELDELLRARGRAVPRCRTAVTPGDRGKSGAAGSGQEPADRQYPGGVAHPDH
jgi:flagellar motor protein MotB